MVRLIRSIACVVVAIATASLGLIWLQVPHAGASPFRQMTSTYDAGVGMIDLYLRDDYRGYERLIQIDPTLEGIGGDAAKSVAADSAFDLERRIQATILLVENQRLDDSFSEVLAEAARSHNEERSFCNIDADLDQRLGCGTSRVFGA